MNNSYSPFLLELYKPVSLLLFADFFENFLRGKSYFNSSPVFSIKDSVRIATAILSVELLGVVSSGSVPTTGDSCYGNR